jgi:hypothetical protein
MNAFKLTMLGLSVCVPMIGCSSEQQEAADDEVVAEEEGVFDPMVGTLDRAAEVDELSKGRMDKLDEQLEESEY